MFTSVVILRKITVGLIHYFWCKYNILNCITPLKYWCWMLIMIHFLIANVYLRLYPRKTSGEEDMFKPSNRETMLLTCYLQLSNRKRMASNFKKPKSYCQKLWCCPFHCLKRHRPVPILPGSKLLLVVASLQPLVCCHKLCLFHHKYIHSCLITSAFSNSCVEMDKGGTFSI